MGTRTPSRELPTAIGGFLIGLVIAAGVVALWLLITRGTAESFSGPRSAIRTSDPAGGVIGRAATAVETRLARERSVVRPVRGDLRFRVERIVWEDRAGPPLARAAEMTGRLVTSALGNGDIVVRGVVIRDGDVLLRQDGPEQWNYRRVLAPLLEDDDDGGRERAFVVTDVALRNIDVRVETPERSFSINDIAAQLPRADFAAPGLPAPRVTIARATGRLLVNDSTYPLLVEDAVVRFPGGRSDFEARRVVTGETRLADLVGSYGGELPGAGLQLSGEVENLRFEDVRFLGPRVPATGRASFSFRLRPITDALTRVEVANARFESEGSRASGSLTLHLTEAGPALEAIDARFDPIELALVERLMGDTLPYQGVIAGTARGTAGRIDFDVTTRLRAANVTEPLSARVTGSARVAAGAFELTRLEVELRDAPLAALRAVFPALPLKGAVSGKVALTGAPGRAPLAVDVRLELGSGVVLVEGRVDLSNPIPSYDLSGRVIAINLQQLVQPDVPPVFLTARFSLAGRGAAPAQMDARMTVDGRFTGWRSTPSDTVQLLARIQNGSVQIDAAALQLASMSARAEGRWRFSAPAGGSIEYQVAFNPITPFGPYVPVIGDEDASGDLRVAGTVSGELGRIRIAGDATANAFTVGAWSVAALEGRYDLIVGPAVPEVALTAEIRDLRTPTAGSYETATAKVELQPPRFALDLRAGRPASDGGIEVVADGRIPQTGAREVIVHRARLDLGAENWALTRPATFSWAAPGSGLDVAGFELREQDGAGLVRLEGRVLPLAAAEFRLETVALPVGDIQRLLGRPARVAGALTTTTDIRVAAGVPRIDTRFQLEGATVENVRFAQISGDVAYAGETLTANATAADSAGSLQLSAELPMDIHLGDPRRIRLRDAGAVRVRVQSDSVALAPFAALHPAVQEMAGTLAADITVTGTVETPVLGGSLLVRGGAARIVPLNQRFDSINGRIAFANRRAVIEELVARSGGHMRATGAIEFEDLTKPVLDLAVELTRLELIGVDNHSDAAISGTVALDGPVGAAVLTGGVRIEDGFVPIPQTGTRTLDAELAQFERDLPARVVDAPASTSFYSSLTIDDLDVEVGDDVWFVMEDARAQLTGDLSVDKNGDVLTVVGELTGERGTYTLRAGPIIRRFDVLRANIRFLGGRDINPALDILARRRVIDQTGDQFDIEVRIGGTMERPTLALASTAAGTIPQSELLSFLLFGRPSVALGGTTLTAPRELIGETYIGGIAELLSMEIEQAVIDEMGMGLDIFQIRLGGGQLANLDRASLVVGEEIGSNLFLTVESGVETLFGGAGGSAAATFALRIEWRVTDHTTVRASYEPVNDARALRGSAITPTVLERKYQRTLELRRRWTW